LSLIGVVATIGLGTLLSGTEVAPTSAQVAPLIMLGLSAAGVANVGLQASLYALAACAYPTRCRTSGVGWASSIGRAGAIASAFGGGAVLALANGTVLFFVILSVLGVLVGTGVLVVDKHVR